MSKEDKFRRFSVLRAKVIRSLTIVAISCLTAVLPQSRIWFKMKVLPRRDNRLSLTTEHCGVLLTTTFGIILDTDPVTLAMTVYTINVFLLDWICDWPVCIHNNESYLRLFRMISVWPTTNWHQFKCLWKISISFKINMASIFLCFSNISYKKLPYLFHAAVISKFVKAVHF